MSAVVSTARAVGILPEHSRAAIDSTGLETRHISTFFRWRNRRPESVHQFPKLTVLCDLGSHLWLAAHVCLGPSQDSPQFEPVVRQAARLHRLDEVLGDKGYDAEHNHQLCRDELGIPSTLIAVRRRTGPHPTRQWPSGRYRREMKRRIRRSDYGQRWQIESSFSRHKRLLGSALRARSWPMQQWECMLRAITHDLMLIAAA
jgi:DDE family transposase